MTIPEKPPKVQFNGTPRGGTVTVRGTERLGALMAAYSSGPPVSYLADTTHLAKGACAFIEGGVQPNEPKLQSVTAASVSDDWPAYGFPVGDPEPLPPVGATGTNVEHGLGYVGGAITRTVCAR